MAEEIALVPETALIVIPITGEAIEFSDAHACARALQEVREIEARLRDVKRALTEGIIEESQRQGSKTLHFSGFDARINNPPTTVWDYEVLCELLEAGLPEERFADLVTTEISYKVNGNVAKSVASSNPDYKAIIDRAKATTYGQPTVSILRG